MFVSLRVSREAVTRIEGQNQVCSSIVGVATRSDSASVRSTLHSLPSSNARYTLSYTSSTRPSQCACWWTTRAPGRHAANGCSTLPGTCFSTVPSAHERSKNICIATTIPVCPSWSLLRATMSPRRKRRSASDRFAASSVRSLLSFFHTTWAAPAGSLPEVSASSMMSSPSDSSSLLFGALSTMPISPSFVTRSSVKIVWLGIGRDRLEALPLLAGPACLLCPGDRLRTSLAGLCPVLFFS